MTEPKPTPHPHKPIGGTNLEFARSHNRRAVLEVVRRAGVISRADIARQTALTLQTISNIVDELERTGLLSAGKPLRGARGQPSIPYTINPQGGWSIGVHLARHSVIAVLADLTGQPIASRDIAASPSNPAVTLPIVLTLMQDLMAEADVPLERCLGIGIALPTRFDLGSLSTAGPTGLPGWSNAVEREAFRNALPVPVFIENDAVAAAIGERLYGVAREIESFVLLFLDDGLGAGLFLGGQPFKGSFSNAGELGHMIVDPGGKACPCGNRGCLERYVSLSAAFECLEIAPESTNADELDRLALAEPERLAGWLQEAGPRLSIATNVLEMVLDPETIIIAGLASETVIDLLIESANPLPVSVGARHNRPFPRLMAGRVGRQSTAFGAAALPVFDEMNPRFDVLLKG